MSAALQPDGSSASEDQQTPTLVAAPDAVEVRRSAGLAALLGAGASGLAIAYLARSVAGGSVVDWALTGVMALLGAVWLGLLVDARTPLLVADATGVRFRLGRSWRGLPWSAVHHLEHTPRRGPLHDGRLAILPRNPDLLAEELTGSAARRAAWATRRYGAPLALPLGLSTRVVGAGDDLAEALERVAARATDVVVVTEHPVDEAATEVDGADIVAEDAAEAHVTGARVTWPDPRPRLASVIARVGDALPTRRTPVVDEDPEPGDVPDTDDAPTSEQWAASVVASETPAPLRETRAAVRADLRQNPEVAVPEPGGRELRRPGSVSLVEDTQVWGDRVRPISRGGDAVEPLVLDDFAVEPAEDPVVGPEVAAARTRLGLTVDQLAERTRIRPHVIESIEVDDFAPCGGDFYARGHLRTLARVLGVDATPLLSAYDERYAHAEINPRRVFEAELATGAHGSIRGTRGGPNWSVLVAVVMALVLAWSIARLVMDAPPELRDTTPVLDGSGGPAAAGGSAALADPVAIVLAAPDGGAHIVVRDAAGEVIYKGSLAFGATKEVEASPPVRVQTSDGSVTVSIGGADRGPVGTTGEAAQGTYVPR